MPGEAPSGTANIREAVARLWTILERMRGPGVRPRIAAALGLTLAAKIVAVLAPLVLADAINRLAAPDATAGAPPDALPLVVTLIALWAGLRFASTAGPQLRDALFAPVAEEAQRRAARAVFAHLHTLSLGFHHTKRTGALSRAIERGVRAIDFLLRFLAFNIAPTLIELALAAGVLALTYGTAFALIAAGTVGLYAWMTVRVTRWRLAHRRLMNERDAAAQGQAVDSLLNFETVKSFGAEAREVARYDQFLAAYAQAAVKANASLVLLNVLQGVVMNLGLAAMVVWSAVEVTGRAMGPGDIAAVMLIMLNLYQPLNILGMAYREIRQSAIDLEIMFGLLDEQPAIPDRPDAPALNVTQGRVTFEAVRFLHDGRQAGLDGVGFTVAPGTKTAIVGPSGAGKSTLLKLLFRFYDPASGRVLIDGQDIRDVRQTSLRACLGLVPQDVVLFNDTIRANIAYGRPEADMAALEAAAEGARLLQMIQSLPQGWETLVGERGLKLSGGERQRVGIARVLLKNPRILVLDEATASLDSRTEAEVQTALDDAGAGRTVLVVAHRLSTIADADQIVVLKDGRIVERGTHADLVAAGGDYAQLWRRQALGAP